MTSTALPPRVLRVPADHPMLPGHFPGEPIVPGAYLLAWTVDAARHALAAAADPRVVTGVARVKFQRPLRPELDCTCTFTASASTLRFALATADGPIAAGTLSLAPTP